MYVFGLCIFESCPVQITPEWDENLWIFNSTTSTSTSASCLSVILPKHTSEKASLLSCKSTFSLLLPSFSHKKTLSLVSTHPLLPLLSSLPHCLLLSGGLDPKYLNSSNFNIRAPCSFTFPLDTILFTHMYSVLRLLTFIPALLHVLFHLLPILIRCVKFCHIQAINLDINHSLCIHFNT